MEESAKIYAVYWKDTELLTEQERRTFKDYEIALTFFNRCIENDVATVELWVEWIENDILKWAQNLDTHHEEVLPPTTVEEYDPDKDPDFPFDNLLD